MTKRPVGLALVRWFSARLLSLYPRGFRDLYHREFTQVAEHRWRRERRATGSSSRATLTTLLLMVQDLIHSAPLIRRGGIPRLRMQFFHDLSGDLRSALRGFRRRPVFSLLVIMTLGIGIGASSAVFGALDRVVLRPLPYPDGDRMAYAVVRHNQRDWEFAPPQEAVDRWREGARTIEAVETHRRTSMVLTGDGPAQLLEVMAVSGGMPAMLHLVPVAGRLLGPNDAAPNAQPVVMLSESFWRGRFGASESAIGTALRLNDTLFTVAGVWPEVAHLDIQDTPALYRVLPRNEESSPGFYSHVIVLIREAVPYVDAEIELATLAQDLETMPSNTTAGINPSYGVLGDEFVRGLWLVFGAGLVLMVVAVANATNLMLGRLAGRRREIGMRLALGSSGYRLIRLFLTETTVLAVAAVVVAVGVAEIVGVILEAVQSSRMIPPGTVGLQNRALLFALSLAGVSALSCAMLPALHVRTGDVRSLVGRGESSIGRGAFGMRGVLVAVQAAMAVAIVVGAALLGRSFVAIQQIHVGVDLDRLAVISVRANENRFPTPESRASFFAGVQAVFEGLPGVTDVTTTSSGPLSFSLSGRLPYLDGEPEPEVVGADYVLSNAAPPGYFKTLGIPVLAGRSFASGDSAGVIIVNDGFARSRGGDVLGRTLRIAGSDTLRYTIIGIAGDVGSPLNLFQRRDQLYYPHVTFSSYTRFVIRTSQDPENVIRAAATRMGEAYPSIPLREATTGPQIIREQTSRVRLLTVLLVGFGVLGLTLAVSGVYGAVSLDVGQRTREMGIRMAIGASMASVRRHVLSRGLRPVAAGALAGTIVTLVVSPRIESLLFEVPTRDVWSVLIGLLLLLVTGLLACLLPARRASRIDPAGVLRVDT